MSQSVTGSPTGCASQPGLVSRGPLDPEREARVREVSSYFSIRAPLGIALDDEDYPELPWPWTAQGLHLPVRYEGVPPSAPEFIQRQVRSMRFDHLVWTSGRVTRTVDDLEFTWILAHELRHAEQGWPLNRETGRLWRGLQRIRPGEAGSWAEVPAEVDAELAAWRVTRAIFGATGADAWVERRTREGERTGFFQLLRELGPRGDYEPYEETVKVIERYRRQLLTPNADGVVPYPEADDAIRGLRRTRENALRGAWSG